MEATLEEPLNRRLRLQGSGKAYFNCEELEVLCHGGARLGKSFSLMCKTNWTARKYPESRQLWVRKTRKSFNESILPDWEKEVLWAWHPAVQHGPSHWKDRDFYKYPNGAEIWIAGFDSQEKIDDILSSKWDRIYIFQCEQLRKEDWEKLCSRLSAFNTPYHQITGDVNPAPASHWLAKRFGVNKAGIAKPPEGKEAFAYNLKDNPRWYTPGVGFGEEGTEVKRILEATLTGVQRERLLLHRWVTAEGAIWPEFDQDTHMVFMKDVPPIKWHFGSFDWGYRAPGTFQVWGVDGERRMYLIAQVYKTGKTRAWWREVAVEYVNQYDLRRIVWSHEDAEGIDVLNDMLTERDLPRLVAGPDFSSVPGRTALQTGLDLVRWLLHPAEGGDYYPEIRKKGPMMFIVHDSLRHGRDEKLYQAGKETCFEDEIGGFVFMRDMDGKPRREKDERPDPDCADHGCEAAWHAAVFLWHNDLTPILQPEPFAPGSMGDVLNHAEVWDE